MHRLRPIYARPRSFLTVSRMACPPIIFALKRLTKRFIVEDNSLKPDRWMIIDISVVRESGLEEETR